MCKTDYGGGGGGGKNVPKIDYVIMWTTPMYIRANKFGSQ